MAAKYLTMVGQLQWLVTLGRFDIHTQVATMSRLRAAPRQGHMDRLKRIYSYAIRTKDYAIRFRTDQPDYSFLPDQDFDWTYSVYGNVQEILPDDMPDPLGEAVITTTTMDANLNHCLLLVNLGLDASTLSTRHLLTGILRNKPQWRQLHMVQSLLLPKLQQNRSWTLGRP